MFASAYWRPPLIFTHAHAAPGVGYDTLRTDLTGNYAGSELTGVGQGGRGEAWGKASVSFVANGLTTTIETDDLTDLKKSPLKFKEA